MKRYTLLLIWLISLVGTVFAQQDNKALFDQATNAYNAGSYDTAAVLYEKIVADKMESVPLFYNLGNTYYRMHEIPLAIYYYEKALKLDPSNEEVQNNLAFVNQFIDDKSEAVPQSFFVKGWHNVKNKLLPDQWAWCSIAAFALLLVALFLFLRSRSMGMRKLGFFSGIVFLIVFAFSVLFAVQLKQSAITQDQAIVMAPTVTVKSTPNNETSVDLFVLHEGTKVSILDSADGWQKIKIANGSIGWLPEGSMRAF